MITYADASNNNGVVDWTPYPAGCMKSSQGTSFRDAFYAGSRAQLVAQGKPFSAYHWLDASNVLSQAMNAALVAPPGDSMMLDCEDLTAGGSATLTVPQIQTAITMFRNEGFIVWDIYLPRWYHQRMGSPDLTWMHGYDVLLHGSDYDENGQPSPLAFQPIGGMPVSLNQWTSNDSTEHLDNNRWPGTIEQLAAAMRQTVPIGDIGMTAYILTGFPNQPAWTEGRYHVADNSAQGYHVAPLGAWNAAAWPAAPTFTPAQIPGHTYGPPTPTGEHDVLESLFGLGAPGPVNGLVGAHTHSLTVGGTVGPVTP